MTAMYYFTSVKALHLITQLNAAFNWMLRSFQSPELPIPFDPLLLPLCPATWTHSHFCQFCLSLDPQ